MKKNIILASAIAMLAMTSCNNSTKQDTPPPPAEKPRVHADSTAPDGTTIKVNDNGVSIESKDGSKKNSVKVSRDSASIQLSTPK